MTLGLNKFQDTKQIIIKSFIAFAFVLFSIDSFAQNIDLNYYSTGAGKNVSVSYSKIMGKSEIGIGLGYNIGSIKQPDDQNNIYYKRLFPTKPIHYFNTNSFFNYYFYNKWDCLKPLLFYDLQIKYSTTRTSMYVIHDYDPTLNGDTPEENLLYRHFAEYFGPFLWVENTLGLGIKVDISEKIYLKQKAGLGIYLISGEEAQLLKLEDEWEFFPFINIGVGLKLENK